jgi:hypothetical protein
MTIFLENQHPRASAGTFADKLQSRPEILLGSALLPPSDYEVDTSFPIPQANDLEKIAAIVDVVDAGANTGDAVAETFGLSGRQGQYYMDAAGYLGFVDAVPSEAGKTYELTSLGAQMLASDNADRVAILRHVVAAVPAIQTYMAEGEDAMLNELSDAGLGDGTAERRGACATSWFQALTHDETFDDLVGEELNGARERAGAAAAHAYEARTLRISALAPRRAAVCTSCFMELPASGVCSC